MWRDFIFIFIFDSTFYRLWPHWLINLIRYYGRKMSLYDTLAWKTNHSLDLNSFSLQNNSATNSCQMAVLVVCSFPAVDGRFTTWTRWSKCSRSCGFKGFSVRSRSCTAPKHGGLPCYGAGIDTRECNRKHCPGKVRIFSQLSYQGKRIKKTISTTSSIKWGKATWTYNHTIVADNSFYNCIYSHIE